MKDLKDLKEMSNDELESTLRILEAELLIRYGHSEEAKREATRQIAKKLNQISNIYKECTQLAREAGVEFRYCNPDGTGGYFSPDEENGWQNSSMNC